MSKYQEALDNAIREFEVDFEEDCDNEWLKNEIEGLKETKIELERLEEENAKLKKAIEILKTKRVDIYDLQECVRNYSEYRKYRNPFELYNVDIELIMSDNNIYLDTLTEEEFNVLKEVFE